MPARRLLVRKIREILRLKHERGLSHRAIARACGIGVGTVSVYLQRTAQRGLGWPLPAELDDAAIEARLFPRAAPVHDRIQPDCAYIHRELKRDSVTLQLLWEEYAQVHPNGYRRSQFCEIYRQWARRLRPSMRQVHRAGEKTFIDFSGKRPALVDRHTGELRRVELFVAVLGASSFTYAEAAATQQLPDWVDAHTRMVEYFGGTTALWVPDQLKSAITRPCRYEPGVNRTYEDLAAHYGAVVIPARPRKPRDKAAVEAAVLLAQRWILARLRHETFFSLGALNAAIRVLLDELNDRPMKKLGVSRRALYEQLDRPALRPLPATRYVLAYWKLCRVNIFCGLPPYVVQRGFPPSPVVFLRATGHINGPGGMIESPSPSSRRFEPCSTVSSPIAGPCSAMSLPRCRLNASAISTTVRIKVQRPPR